MSSQKKPCSRCDQGKGGGIFTCDGCHQSFCRKHSDEHRQELGTQMDTIGQEHDLLQRDLDENKPTHSVLVQIDAWERESIKRIQQIAGQARIDFNQIINKKKQDMKIAMNKLTNELQTSRQSEDYTELELTEWSDRLTQLRRNLEQLSTSIYITKDEDLKASIQLIQVTDSPPLPQLKPVTNASPLSQFKPVTNVSPLFQSKPVTNSPPPLQFTPATNSPPPFQFTPATNASPPFQFTAATNSPPPFQFTPATNSPPPFQFTPATNSPPLFQSKPVQSWNRSGNPAPVRTRPDKSR